MKRLAIILIAICFGLNSQAQIQTKFWGLEMSAHYPSLEYAKKIIANRCESLEVNNKLNQIIAERGVFGGQEWDYAGFYFHKSCDGQTLHMVSFFNKYKSVTPAQREYEFLEEALTKKYGKPLTKEEDTALLNLWSKGEGVQCLLTANQEENLIIISLNYVDQTALQKSIQQDKDEL